MMMLLLLLSISSSSTTTSIVVVQGHLIDDLQFEWNTLKMPFPLSDMMANYYDGGSDDGSGNKKKEIIIITGGCNAPNGNERVNFGDGDLFACMSTSNKTLIFDPYENTFVIMDDMPHERQRHAATIIDDNLYLLGGRDSNDELVTAIDVSNLCLVFYLFIQ